MQFFEEKKTFRKKMDTTAPKIAGQKYPKDVVLIYAGLQYLFYKVFLVARSIGAF